MPIGPAIFLQFRIPYSGLKRKHSVKKPPDPVRSGGFSAQSSIHFRAAPLHGGEASALRRGQLLGLHLHRRVQPLPRQEHPDQGIGGRVDGQPGGVGVGLGLEGKQIVGIALQLWQPVDDEFVSLPLGQAQPCLLYTSPSPRD